MNKINLDDVKVHFIVGMGRSGTTLLNQILNANPQCLATPELRFEMVFYQKHYKKVLDIKNFLKDIDTYYSIRKPDEAVMSLWQQDDAIFKKWVQNNEHLATYQNIAKSFALSCQHIDRPNDLVRAIVNKNTDYVPWIGQLLTLFPDAKFIVPIRDYRAVLNSNIQSVGVSYHSIIFTLLLWRIYHNKLLQWQYKMPDRFLILKYEDFMAEQTSHVKRICAFLDIDYTSDMLCSNEQIAAWLQQQPIDQISTRKQKKWGDLAKPINSNRSESWRKQLSPDQISLADNICGSIGKKWGYEPIIRLSIKSKVWLWLKNIHAVILSYMLCIISLYYYYMPFYLRIFFVKHFRAKR